MSGKQLSVLIFLDKLGITSGYESVWLKYCLISGLTALDVKFYRVSSYRKFGNAVRLLTYKGNRKTPGFNEDPRVQRDIRSWYESAIDTLKPNAVVIMDPAMFFLVNEHWDQATTEKLRGGVYFAQCDGKPIPVLVMAAISSVFNKVSSKDIAAMNMGFANKEDFDSVYRRDTEQTSDEDEDDADDDGIDSPTWFEPINIQYGRFCFEQDMHKLCRLLRGVNR